MKKLLLLLTAFCAVELTAEYQTDYICMTSTHKQCKPSGDGYIPVD